MRKGKPITIRLEENEQQILERLCDEYDLSRPRIIAWLLNQAVEPKTKESESETRESELEQHIQELEGRLEQLEKKPISAM
jgi:predicted transcriptional regulator YheO